MSELVDHDAIEGIIGADRHPVLHRGRAVLAKGTVYVLHSQEFLDQHTAGTRDMRLCPYSVALDSGIDLGVWGEHVDTAVDLVVLTDQSCSYLVPAGAAR